MNNTDVYKPEDVADKILHLLPAGALNFMETFTWLNARAFISHL